MLCGSWPHEDFGMQLMGSAVLGPVWCVHRCCLCITGTNMILHLARVFYQATFLHKIKLDSSVKNGKFSEFKACRRFFFLPVFSVLSFLEELSKHLIYGCDETYGFRSTYVFLVLGGTRLEAAQSHCFPSILWCCFLGRCKAETLAFLILNQELLRVVRKLEIMRTGNSFLVESLF